MVGDLYQWFRAERRDIQLLLQLPLQPLNGGLSLLQLTSWKFPEPTLVDVIMTFADKDSSLAVLYCSCCNVYEFRGHDSLRSV